MVSSSARRVSAQALRSPKKAHLGSSAFDAKLFLDSTGLGRTVGRYAAKETIFAQGDPAKSVIYIQEGGVKLSVVNEWAKRRLWPSSDREISLGKRALQARRFAWGRRPRLHLPPCWSLKRARCSGCSTESTSSPTVSSPTCWRETSELKRTWSTSCLTPARNDWRERCCCLRVMVYRATRKRFCRMYRKRRWRR